jgi:hypothetical protein
MNSIIKLFIVLAGCMSALPALARDYEVQGVFADGGTFSGTFDYSPRKNSYDNSFADNGVNGGEVFHVSVTGETSGILNQNFAGGFAGSCCAIVDGNSTPTQLVINNSTPLVQNNLTLDWNSALNSPGGHANQLITGGDVMFSSCVGAAELACSNPTQVESRVIGGSITPLPFHNGHTGSGGMHAVGAPEIDPASALSGFTLLGACLAFMRGRRVRNSRSQGACERCV